MSTYTSFLHYFLNTLWKIRVIVFGLFGWLVVDAAVIAYFEKISPVVCQNTIVQHYQ